MAHHHVVAAHRRHEREKPAKCGSGTHKAHTELGHKHNADEAALHEKHEAELAAEQLGTPGGAAAGPAPGGAPEAPNPAGGQAGAAPAPAQGMAA